MKFVSLFLFRCELEPQINIRKNFTSIIVNIYNDVLSILFRSAGFKIAIKTTQNYKYYRRFSEM